MEIFTTNLDISILCSVVLICTIGAFTLWRKNGINKKSKTVVPNVAYSFPIFGHLPQIFFYGPSAFAKAAGRKYGPIFRVKMFSTPFVLLAGKEAQSKFFTENTDFTFNAFFYKWMGDAFFPKKLSLDASNAIARKILKGKVDMDVMQEQANEFLQRLKTQAAANKNVDMNLETERYLIKLGLATFFKFPLGDEFVEDVSGWMNALVFYLKLKVVVPLPLANAIGGWQLNKYRSRVMSELKKCIRIYRDDPYSFESPFLSAAFEKEEGELISDPDDYVAALTLQLLYGILVNARLSILNTIADISENPECAQKVAEIARKCVLNCKTNSAEWENYLQNDFIQACVMESARLRVNFAGLAKSAERPQTNFGHYQIEDGDILSNCSLLAQVYGDEVGIESPGNYNPWRMAGEKKWGPNEVSGWGAGIHACPGKRFSIIEIKLAVAVLFANFSVDLENSHISKRNQMGASGMFNETKFSTRLIPRGN